VVIISYLIPEVYHFELPGFNSNIYVYGKKILIDTGYDPAGADRIIEHLKKYDVKIEKIALTHPHPDHSGNLDRFQKEFDAEVLVYEKLENRYSNFGNKLILLKDGDVITAVDDLKLEVIHTPGHTPFDICFYDPERKVLFSGDCVFSFGSIGRTDMPGGSIQKLVASIKRLAKLDVEWLCPGHMQTVKNGNDHIQQSLMFAEQVAGVY